MYRKILVGFDGSQGSRNALVHAIGLAKLLKAELWALWARSSLPHYPETVDEIDEERNAADAFLQKLTAEIVALSREHGIDIHGDARAGHAPKTLVDYAEDEGFDLIVLGHSGHSRLWGRFLGHTADKVSENAHCSVLIVRD